MKVVHPPDVPQLEGLVVASGGQHAVVVRKLHASDLRAELVRRLHLRNQGRNINSALNIFLHLQTNVDEVLPVVPHLDAAVIAHRAH